MSETKIQWTDHSINPIRARAKSGLFDSTTGEREIYTGHHCEKISPGCKNCYASKLQPRFQMPPFDKRQDVEIEHFLDESKLQQVLRRRKPTKYFWCDMTDMFGDWVKDEWLDKIFATMALAYLNQPRAYWSDAAGRGAAWLWGGEEPDDVYDTVSGAIKRGPLPNVWLGVSAEDQQRADERIPTLLQIPAAVRFVSYEPALEYVSFMPWIDRLDWVIVGGESGPGARPFDLLWARVSIEILGRAGVPVFMKQIGANAFIGPAGDGLRFTPKDKKGGNIDEWPEALQVRQFPSGPAAQDEAVGEVKI